MFTTGKIYSHVCPHARVSLGRPIVSGCWSPCLEVDAFMERRRNSCCCPERRSGICHLCLSPGGCCFPQSNQSTSHCGVLPDHHGDRHSSTIYPRNHYVRRTGGSSFSMLRSSSGCITALLARTSVSCFYWLRSSHDTGCIEWSELVGQVG